MSYLPKKTRNYYSRQIETKLKAMGLKDEIVYIASGKKAKRLKLDAEGKPSFKDGVLETETVDIPLAQNRLRQALKRLRNQPFEIIESFLNMQMQAPVASPAPTVTVDQTVEPQVEVK